jgi:methionyl-tRNA synthetase
VPAYDDIDGRGNELINMADSVFNTIFSDDGLLYNCNFKQALKMAMTVAQETNRYLDEKSPWKIIKEDKPAAANSLYVALGIISRLKTMLYPFLPFSSQKVHEYLGFKGKVEDYAQQKPLKPLPEPGQRLQKPEPLFVKLDEALVEEETGRLGSTGD